MHSFQPPARVLEHGNGLWWQARAVGAKLQIAIRDAEGDGIERTRVFADSVAAATELERLVGEQLAEGFVEISPPAWRVFVDELVAHWASDDPTFDASSLRQRLVDASATAVVERLMALSDRWITQRDGSVRLDFSAKGSLEADPLWFKQRIEQSLPALMLGLRHHDGAAQLRIDAILGTFRRSEALPALLSVLDHPAPNLAAHLGGRACQHIPAFAIAALGPPAPDVAARLTRALAHEDFRVAVAAAAVLAEHARENRLFAPLLACVARGKREDGFAGALLRAAEVRRDPALRPFLEWMHSHFKSAGYSARIREALAALAK